MADLDVSNSVDLEQVRQLVKQAVQAATRPEGLAERKLRPESTISFFEPTPLAGFHAARQVCRLAEQQVYRYAVLLRGEGFSWQQIADLLEIPWSDDYARPERAFNLVAGPDSGNTWTGPRVYWHCGSPAGCGAYITDRGPFNGWPSDNEDGHADGCRRLAAENDAHERESQDRDRRAEVMDEAYHQLEAGSFAQSTADRARWVRAHGGRYLGWSTSESLAVALVLDDSEALKLNGYPKRRDAIERVTGGMTSPPSDVDGWLALVRAAATGEANVV